MLTISARVGDKALRYVEEGRVYISPRDPHRALVLGDSGPHVVQAVDDLIHCDCQGWRHDRPCSHWAAAAVIWQERRREETP